MEKNVGREKHVFIEVIRIVACFFAMVNHSTALYYNPNASIYMESPKRWFVSLVYLFLCKMAIPLFVMISGYNMLGKVDDYKKSGKRLLRIIMVILVFSSIYYMNRWINGALPTISVIEYINSIIYCPQTFSHWYLYMYIGLLLMMPFLQKMIANMNKLDCQIMIGISLFVYGTLPIIEYNWPQLTTSKLMDYSLFTSFINMMLIGHYIKKYVEPTKKVLIISSIGFIVTMVFNVWISCYEFQKNAGSNYLFYENRVLINIILEAAFFFNIVRCIKWKDSWSKWIKLVGGCTFGMYLFNDLIIEKTMFLYYYFCEKGIWPNISEVIWQIVIFTISLIITLILKQVPFIKKLI